MKKFKVYFIKEKSSRKYLYNSCSKLDFFTDDIDLSKLFLEKWEAFSFIRKAVGDHNDPDKWRARDWKFQSIDDYMVVSRGGNWAFGKIHNYLLNKISKIEEKLDNHKF